MTKKKSIARTELTDVEKAERLVAEAVANARSAGLKHTTGKYFDDFETPTCACAVGALSLSHAKNTNEAWKRLPNGGATLGSDCGETITYGEGLGFDIGAAYRDIMLEEAGKL